MGGLKVRIESRRQYLIARACYLPSEIVEVSFEPSSVSKGSFVRSQSVHFDLDSDGYPSCIEVMGPPRHSWYTCELPWPHKVEPGEVRFLQPEQCEEEDTERFETNADRNLLRIVFTQGSADQYVAPAATLLFGVDRQGELVELWIDKIQFCGAQ